MIIDVHNHLGEPWGTRFRQTPKELLERMDRAGIDIALVTAFPFGNFDNEYVARAVAQHPDRLRGLVMVSPFAEEMPRNVITRYIDGEGFSGIKLHPAAHGYKLSEHAVCADILEEAAERRLTILAYSGDELYAAPFQVRAAAVRYPTVDFIMAHSGFMMQTNDAVLVAMECENVYLEHSSGISLGVTQSIDAIGADRVVLGSDTPHMDFEVELYKLRISISDTEQRAKVLGGNAARLFGITS